MPKVSPVETNGNVTGYFFDCPGCGGGHQVTVSPFKAENGASWTFNGDLDYPTFVPSILSRIDRTDRSKAMTCHLFVRNGGIEFLNDCTHALAGQKVMMTDV